MQTPPLEDIESEISEEDKNKLKDENKKSPKKKGLGMEDVARNKNKLSKNDSVFRQTLITKSFTVRKYHEIYILELIQKKINTTGRTITASKLVRDIFDEYMENHK